MLRQDPELDRPRGAPRASTRRRRTGLLAAAAGVVALALVALAALAGSDEAAPEAPRAEGLAIAVSPRSGAVQARIAVGATPSAVASARATSGS
jgi:hypothetical protein